MTELYKLLNMVPIGSNCCKPGSNWIGEAVGVAIKYAHLHGL